MLRYDYDEFRVALGKRIKELRKQRGMTHRVMVSAHGFHLTQIARIERGESFSVPTLLRLAETFQVPVGELISGIGEIDGDVLRPKAAVDSKGAKEVKPPKEAKASKK
jgi:transcriptional regulator with XRE-family HTH domain